MLRKFDHRDFGPNEDPESAPIIRIIITIIGEAVKSEAREIKLETVESVKGVSYCVKVSYLLGDEWQEYIQLPVYIRQPVNQRLRIMASLDAVPANPAVSETGSIPLRYETRDFTAILTTEPVESWENIRIVLT